MKIILLVVLASIFVFASSIKLPEHFIATFEQIITNSKNKVLRYHGKIFFSNPSHLKWSYIKPTKKEVCVTKDELSIIDHDLEQVSFLLIDKAFNFVRIIESAKLHHDKIYLSHYNDTAYTIELNKDNKIQSVAFFDNIDNKVQITFRDIVYGRGALQTQLMICEAPKTYDIIRE